MTESPVQSIKIVKKVPFSGLGDTLESRLRNVRLRGFPEIKIYENAQIQTEFLTSDQISQKLHTPQLRVYRENMQRIGRLAQLFKEQEIDILNLDYAYDYEANHEDGTTTEWTMLPPILERFKIPKLDGKLDYSTLIGPSLRKQLEKENLGINPEVQNLNHTSESEFFDLINDGSHRIHYGFENGGIKVIKISGMTEGFPYYAAPQKYNVTVYQTREEAFSLPESKVHIITSPGHKHLYRVFPTGGIKSGNVRPH